MPIFFLARQYQKYVLSDTLATQVILHTKFASICTIPWHDEKDLFFENSLIAKNQKFPYEIIIFFLGKLYRKFPFFYALPTQGLLNTEIGSISTNLDLIKMTYFQKSLFAKFANFRKFPYEIPTFFLAKQYKNSFSSDTLATQVILHTNLASICTTPWHDEKDLFSKFVIREIQKFPYWILTFFLGKLYQKFFFLCSTYTVATEYRVWFDFDKSLTWSKWPIFKSRYSQNWQIFANFRMKYQLFF